MIFSRRLLLAAGLVAFSLPGISLAQDKPNDAVVARDGNWMKRHESFNERVKQGNVDLIFIGDSITQGWEGAGKDVWDEFYGKRNAVNLGIGGDRTQHVLWRLDHGNIDGIKPKLAVLMIGTNNSGSEHVGANRRRHQGDRREAPREAAGNESADAGHLSRAAPTRTDAQRRKVNEGANEIVKKLADDKMVFFLDIGPKFLAADGTLSKEVMPDLLHLNEGATAPGPRRSSRRSRSCWAKSSTPFRRSGP